jgi:hypothetical protein
MDLITIAMFSTGVRRRRIGLISLMLVIVTFIRINEGITGQLVSSGTAFELEDDLAKGSKNFNLVPKEVSDPPVSD